MSQGCAPLTVKSTLGRFGENAQRPAGEVTAHGRGLCLSLLHTEGRYALCFGKLGHAILRLAQQTARLGDGVTGAVVLCPAVADFLHASAL